MTSPLRAITSLTNPLVKTAVRLRDRRERDRTGQTLVDGPRELLRALESGVDVVASFVCDELIRTADAEKAVRRLLIAGAKPMRVSPDVIAKVAYGNRSDGVAAIVRIPDTSLDRVFLVPDALFVVIESVEKPGNLGAILRSADGAGADAVIAADPQTDLFNPNAIRASLGTIFSVPIATATTEATLQWLIANKVLPIAARVDARRTYTEIDFRGPVAIVLGSEADGLSTAWDDPGVEPVRIPMLGASDSLNVSAAAAVLLYEALRQRSASPDL